MKNTDQNYYKTKETVQEYITMAKDVNGGELIDKLKSFLPKESLVLEIGSGPGTDWKILSQDFDVVGSDNSQEFIFHLEESNPNGTFIELDAVTLNTGKIFDGIYANKVMHHLQDDELIKSIQRQYEVLKPEGVICLSFWKGQGSEIFKGLFVNYHDESSIKKYFESKFEILLLESYQEFESEDSLLLIARRK